jgi:membrane protein
MALSLTNTLISVRALRFTASLLLARLREDRLGQTAGSLTFTTALSLVPLLAVALAIFSAFPAFGKFQLTLQGYLLENLIPDSMAQQIMRYLNTFAGKARSLTWAGLLVVVFTAVTLMLTIDKTFNTIWRVQRPRPIAQRVLVYWGAITLGPLVLGAVFSVSSYLTGASRGHFAALPGWLAGFAEVASWVVLAAAIAGLYRVIPNAQVSWRDALFGGVFAALAFEAAKRIFTGYVMAQPTYTSVYGAFAIFPLFLVWIFTSWLIVLFGAVIAAYAPSIRSQALPKPQGAGAVFMDSMGLLRALDAARKRGFSSQSAEQLATALQRDSAYVNELTTTLQEFQWIGEIEVAGERRWALICDPAATSVRPLAERWVFAPIGSGREPVAASLLGKGADSRLSEWFPTA